MGGDTVAVELAGETQTPEHAAARSRPPLVLLHGLFGSAANFRSIARRLAETRPVIALDARNHGASAHAPSMSYGEMAQDVLAYLDGQGLERVALLGHSMGGKTAMRFACEAPERVERLIVVDVAPVAYPGDALARYLEAMRALDLERLERRSDAERALAEAVPDAAVRAFLAQNLMRVNGGLAWRLNLEGIEASLASLLASPLAAHHRYPGPTLFLHGERSDYVRAQHAALIREHFPAATLEPVADAGHWVHAEQPARFLERLSAFLDGGSSAPAGGA